jgi:hypothetical protein
MLHRSQAGISLSSDLAPSGRAGAIATVASVFTTGIQFT